MKTIDTLDPACIEKKSLNKVNCNIYISISQSNITPDISSKLGRSHGQRGTTLLPYPTLNNCGGILPM